MVTTNFIWDELSDNVRMEVDETGAVTAEYMNEPSQFGNLLSQRRGGTNSFYHFDSQSSTRQLTTDDQNVSNTYSYTAYGEPVTSSGTTANPFQYYGEIGYYSDEETGEVYVRRRSYSPGPGRWLTVDPLGFIDGPNVYLAYFVPNGTDPEGTGTVCCQFERGWIVPELFFRNVDCADEKTGRECCDEYSDGWYRTITVISGPCCFDETPSPEVGIVAPAAVTTLRQATLTPKVAPISGTVPIVACCLYVAVAVITWGDQPAPPDAPDPRRRPRGRKQPKHYCVCFTETKSPYQTSQRCSPTFSGDIECNNWCRSNHKHGNHSGKCSR